jgi:hypothetical protein
MSEEKKISKEQLLQEARKSLEVKEGDIYKNELGKIEVGGIEFTIHEPVLIVSEIVLDKLADIMNKAEFDVQEVDKKTPDLIVAEFWHSIYQAFKEKKVSTIIDDGVYIMALLVINKHPDFTHFEDLPKSKRIFKDFLTHLKLKYKLKDYKVPNDLEQIEKDLEDMMYEYGFTYTDVLSTFFQYNIKLSDITNSLHKAMDLTRIEHFLEIVLQAGIQADVKNGNQTFHSLKQ